MHQFQFGAAFSGALPQPTTTNQRSNSGLGSSSSHQVGTSGPASSATSAVDAPQPVPVAQPFSPGGQQNIDFASRSSASATSFAEQRATSPGLSTSFSTVGVGAASSSRLGVGGVAANATTRAGGGTTSGFKAGNAFLAHRPPAGAGLQIPTLQGLKTATANPFSKHSLAVSSSRRGGGSAEVPAFSPSTPTVDENQTASSFGFAPSDRSRAGGAVVGAQHQDSGNNNASTSSSRGRTAFGPSAGATNNAATSGAQLGGAGAANLSAAQQRGWSVDRGESAIGRVIAQPAGGATRLNVFPGAGLSRPGAVSPTSIDIQQHQHALNTSPCQLQAPFGLQLSTGRLHLNTASRTSSDKHARATSQPRAESPSLLPTSSPSYARPTLQDLGPNVARSPPREHDQGMLATTTSQLHLQGAPSPQHQVGGSSSSTSRLHATVQGGFAAPPQHQQQTLHSAMTSLTSSADHSREDASSMIPAKKSKKDKKEKKRSKVERTLSASRSQTSDTLPSGDATRNSGKSDQIQNIEDFRQHGKGVGTTSSTRNSGRSSGRGAAGAEEEAGAAAGVVPVSHYDSLQNSRRELREEIDAEMREREARASRQEELYSGRVDEADIDKLCEPLPPGGGLGRVWHMVDRLNAARAAAASRDAPTGRKPPPPNRRPTEQSGNSTGRASGGRQPLARNSRGLNSPSSSAATPLASANASPTAEAAEALLRSQNRNSNNHVRRRGSGARSSRPVDSNAAPAVVDHTIANRRRSIELDARMQQQIAPEGLRDIVLKLDDRTHSKWREIRENYHVELEENESDRAFLHDPNITYDVFLREYFTYNTKFQLQLCAVLEAALQENKQLKAELYDVENGAPLKRDSGVRRSSNPGSSSGASGSSSSEVGAISGSSPPPRAMSQSFQGSYPYPRAGARQSVAPSRSAYSSQVANAADEEQYSTSNRRSAPPPPPISSDEDEFIVDEDPADPIPNGSSSAVTNKLDHSGPPRTTYGTSKPPARRPGATPSSSSTSSSGAGFLPPAPDRPPNIGGTAASPTESSVVGSNVSSSLSQPSSSLSRSEVIQRGRGGIVPQSASTTIEEVGNNNLPSARGPLGSNKSAEDHAAAAPSVLPSVVVQTTNKISTSSAMSTTQEELARIQAATRPLSREPTSRTRSGLHHDATSVKRVRAQFVPTEACTQEDLDTSRENVAKATFADRPAPPPPPAGTTDHSCSPDVKHSTPPRVTETVVDKLDLTQPIDREWSPKKEQNTPPRRMSLVPSMQQLENERKMEMKDKGDAEPADEGPSFQSLKGKEAAQGTAQQGSASASSTSSFQLLPPTGLTMPSLLGGTTRGLQGGAGASSSSSSNSQRGPLGALHQRGNNQSSGSGASSAAPNGNNDMMGGSGTTTSGDLDHDALALAAVNERLQRERDKVPEPGEPSIAQHDTMLYLLDEMEREGSRVRLTVPPNCTKQTLLRFEHNGRHHEVPAPENAIEGEEVLYRIPKRPPLERNHVYAAARQRNDPQIPDRRNITDQVRMPANYHPPKQDLDESSHVSLQEQIAQAPDMLSNAIFTQRHDLYRWIRGRNMDPLLAYTPEETLEQIKEEDEE